MVFGDEDAIKAKNINSGTVIALQNPRLLPPSSSGAASEKNQSGLTFCIDTIEAII